MTENLIEKHSLGDYVSENSEGHRVINPSFLARATDPVNFEDILVAHQGQGDPRGYDTPKAATIERASLIHHPLQLRLPLFAVYSLDSPTCEIGFEICHAESYTEETARWVFETKTNEEHNLSSIDINSPRGLPSLIGDQLQKAIALEDSFCDMFNTVSFHDVKSTFQRDFPDHIRKIIEESGKNYGGMLYVIGEMENWTSPSFTEPIIVRATEKELHLLS